MNNNATKIVLKLIKNRQITPEEGAQLIKKMTVSQKKNDIQDIAVIGMSGRFPDAQNVNEYWKNLVAGINSVKEIDRWSTDQYYDPDPEVPNKSYSKWGGLLNDIDMFDPSFFKISPREAELMDPQQRLFLQEAWRALEDAGYSPQSLDGKKCGVFVGCSTGDYQHLFAENQIFPQAYSLLGNITSILAARISYLLNLKGPSIAIDTACSSSLVALHLACESIRIGTSDMALAGGVMIYPTPYSFIWASKMGILSPQGKCKTFDQAANGIAIGECAAAVILKPLEAALQSGDNILGIIKGSGINQDGNTDPGITAPSASAQTELETEIYHKYHINPETISYVEAHGTGTKLGDPIEIDGLTQAFRKYTQKKQYCAIGSVKTNIGHAQIAAGIAGFIKLLLCLKHKKLVPSLHLEKENEHLNFPETPFYVNTELKDWKTEPGIPRRAALSSLGFSGTNSHLVVEEYIPNGSLVASETPQLIVLSAANEERLKAYANDIRDFLKISTPFSMSNFAYTLQVGREAMVERLAVLANRIEDVVEKLNQYIDGKTELNGLYCGNIKRDKAEFSILYQGKESLTKTLHEKKLEEIARLWVLGAQVDWQLLYQGQQPQRMSLPTYPFAKKRFWIPIIASQTKEVTSAVTLSVNQTEIQCYQSLWELQKSVSSSSFTSKIVLLFDLTDSRHTSFKAQFACDVILVMPGESYQQLDHQTRIINPNHEEDYRQLLADLNHEPSHIIHLWSQSRFSSATLSSQLEASLFSIVYLSQALLALQPKKPVQLLYAYLTTTEIQPHYAALSGFANTIHQENSKLTYKTLALSSLENISSIALTEFQTPETQVWYEKGQRWVKRLQVVGNLYENTESTLLKVKGVYLITGGAGGLGLIFAEYLAKHFKAKLILTGRSSLSQTQEDKINALNALGAEVVYKRADISKRIDVETLISQIKSEFNHLNGIIHSAGVIKNALINKKTLTEIDTVLAPKVYGTAYLDETTQNEPLDFFVLFSSVIAMMDNIGQSDYAYANAFMDNFAEKREKLRIANKRFGKTLAINWPLWQYGGMQVDRQTEKWLADTMGMLAISNDTGIKAFLQGLSSDCSQFIVLEGDQQKIRKALSIEVTTSLPNKTVAVVEQIQKIETIPLAQLQQALIAIISSNLKVDIADIDIDEDISNYGTDSIMTIMITNQINEQYELELSATLFFDYPSIGKLTHYLCQEYPNHFGGKIDESVVDTVEKISLAQFQQALIAIVSSNLKVDIADIDIDEDISNYGADSIMAIMITNQINEQYELELSATLFFDYPSIGKLIHYLCEEYSNLFARDIQSITQDATILPNETAFLENETVFAEEFPLSYDQQAQWFLQQKEKTTSAYNLSISQRICSPLNIAALEQSFQVMVDRHASLRTVFAMKDDGQLVQKVRQKQRVPFKVIDVSGLDEEALKQKVIETDQLPFDLTTGPLFRIHLFNRAEQDYVLLITMHHIIFDGWSGAIVIEEMSRTYPAIIAGKTPDLPKLSYSYKDYIHWYTTLLADSKIDIQWKYWQQQLSGELPVLQLPTDYPRPQVQTHEGELHFFQLEGALINQLKSLALKEGTTLFSLLLAAFQVFLHERTGQEDIIVGCPFANRKNHKFTGIVGDLVNMVPLRSHCSDHANFSSFLSQVSNTVQDALRHSEYPFQLLVQRLQPKRVPGYSPIFQAVFALQKPLFKNSPWSMMDSTVEKFDWAGLETKGFIIPTAAGRFDLHLEIIELENTLVSWLNYNTKLFNVDTIAHMAEDFIAILQGIVQNTKQPIKALTSIVQDEGNIVKKQTIAITATFTAEPLKDSLDFWMQQLDIPTKVAFAPYNQVFQQLLDPSSLLASNRQGINILLVRFEDWVADKESALSTDFIAKIEKNVQDLSAILTGVVQNATVPYLLCICPASPAMACHDAFFKQMENVLAAIDSHNLYVVKSAGLLTRYPVAEFYNAQGDKEGRVPYTPAFFTALSAIISRKLYTLRQKPYKVIVLDCDNTLWQGVCGEEGVQGIEISPPFQALQKFVLEQQAAGVLLCLCSKNVEEDVFAVIDQRTDMLIKREHLVSWRINWQPKSENIKSLAQELQLGLDSFIFIDDNSVECAVVKAHCPEVLTLQVPEDITTIPNFLRHIWAFDRLKVTTEDQQRTAFYQQDAQRKQLREQAMTLEDFLKSLEIQIHISEMQPDQIARVSQMTQRTNQFNATTIRRTEHEIQQLTQHAHTCLVVEVKDRFGDYGLVGLIIFTTTDNILKVDTFLVSCRVLGRGVEHKMLAKLGEIAYQQGLAGVTIGYKQTSKNKPIRDFLDSVAFEKSLETVDYFWFPTDFCQAIVYRPIANDDQNAASATVSIQNDVRQANSALLYHIATQLSDPEQILQLIESETHAISARPIVAPRNKTETQLAELWQKVLHIESVSIHDNFFEFGGDSLLAVKLMFYVQQTFKRELPLSQLLNAPTVAALAQLLESRALQTDKPIIEVKKRTITIDQEHYPLSYGQQALWFLYQSDQESAAYNVALPLCIRSEINIPTLQNAFQALVNRHPCLRTTFTTIDGKPLQKINQYQITSFEWTDASSWSAEKVQAYVVKANQKPFDLENDPLLRVNLLTNADKTHILLLTIHHIVVDGVSIWMLVEELGQLYGLLKAGRQPILSPLEYSYADFVNWQTQLLENKEESLWHYWQEQLAGELPALNLPTDYPRPNLQSYRGTSVHFVITNPLMSQLKQLAQNERVSFYTVLLAAYQVLLYRYTSQTDILVGSPTTGRTQSEFSGIVGYFVNVVVLRARIQENLTFQDFLQQVQQTVIGALEHQDYPFMRLVERLQPERDPSRSPIFQVDFAFQQLQQGNNLEISGSNEAKFSMKAGDLEFETFELEQQEGLFDLTLDIIETKESLIATFMYNTDLFKEATIKRMVGHFQVLLEGIVANAASPIPKLPLLTAIEQHQLLHEWNNSKVNYPQDKCAHQLFETQVTKTPDAIAVIFAGQQLSYALLNERANQLAHYLQKQGVKPETVVGIYVKRSLEMVIGLLGILKAGGAYLPLDPAHPIERIAFMLEDANVSILLTQSNLVDKCASLNLSVVSLETTQFSAFNTTNPSSEVNGKNLAYVIYTSGSTGMPKGVMLTHQGLRNHNQAFIEQFQLMTGDRCLQFANVNFDVATEEIFPTLLSGATVVLSPIEGFNSFADFQAFIDNNQLTVVNLTASYWHAWVLNLSETIPSSLRLVVVGAEKVPLEPLRAWQKLNNHHTVKWFNVYGPTEATITAMLYEPACAQLDEQVVASVPIGHPIANTQVYVLDHHLQLVPIGVTGELHIGGIALARGYLNNPDLTAEKFIVNPFDQQEQSRLYKTGDLVRYLSDGHIEYLERIDHQVKIRGFRIEIGEIEATLMQHPTVKASLVNLFENKNGKYLVAYVVPVDNHLLDQADWHSELTSYLKGILPDYMVPTTFIILEFMPLTPNGKIDRKALPNPDVRKSTGYAAPRSDIEQRLALIWAAVLKHERVGIHDNFFGLGGDSIRSLQIVAKAKEYNLFIKTNDIFQNQTIAELAAVVRKDKLVQVDQGLVTGKAPLIPIQRAFFARKLPQPAHYNQFVLLETARELNIDYLRQALAALLSHHDALRFTYHQQAGEWQQICDAPSDKIPLFIEDFIDISDTKQLFKQKVEYYQASLNLEQGPLSCLVVFKLTHVTRLLWCIHHLLVDGVSWRILLDDLQIAYQQVSQGESVKLPQKTSSFKAWAENLNQYAQSQALSQQTTYWQEMTAHAFKLPIDHVAGINTLESTQEYIVSLDSANTAVLLKEAGSAYKTRINDLLLTALAQTFSDWMGQRNCLIELESHGRIDLFKELDISRTVGWFTATYPIQLHLPATNEWGECIQAIKQQLNQVPNEGIGYGLQQHQTTFTQILFNYLGQFDQTTEIGLFRPVVGEESFGLSQSLQGERDCVLEINSVVRDSCLFFYWGYSSNLHEAATIQRLADNYIKALKHLLAHCQTILQQARMNPALLLLPIRSAGKKQPFFCLPGMQGVPRYLYPLAHQLDNNQPFYSLQAPEIVGQISCVSVEELATRYIAAIKTIQSQGPYQIGGHSFGAAVAFEMVRQLENANETVSLLVLLDESAPIENTVIADKTELEELTYYLQWLAYFNEIAVYEGNLAPYTPDERFELAVKYLNQAGLALDRQELETTYRAFTNNYKCYNRYLPKGKVSSRVVLLQSEEQDSEHETQDLGWQRYVTQSVETYQVVGGHFSMLALPHVKTTAEIMSNVLL